MTQITQISVREPARVNTQYLDALHKQLGEGVADNVICHALEELAVRLGTIDQAYRTSEFDVLRRHLRGLIAISDQLGLHGIVAISKDVVTCIDEEDPTALSATQARLMRQGDAALSAVWDFQDHVL